MLGFRRFGTVAVVTTTLLAQMSAPSFALAQSSPSVNIPAAGEVLRSVFVDLRTTVGTEHGIDIRFEKTGGLTYKIAVRSAEADIHRMTVVFGTGNFSGVPVAIVSEAGRIDLQDEWKQQLDTYKTQQDVFMKLNKGGGGFQAWYETNIGIANLVAPITKKISNFIVQGFEEGSHRRHKMAQENKTTEVGLAHYVTVNRFEDRVMSTALVIGAALVGVGGYLLFNNHYSHSMLPLEIMLAGTGVFLLNLVNITPEFVSRDRSYLGQLLESWLDRRAYAKAQAAYAKESILEVRHRATLEAHAENRTYAFGQVDLALTSRSMTDVKSDAWIVPHFQSGENVGGVLGAVARAVGAHNASAFEKIVDTRGKMPFGSLTVTPVVESESTRYLFNAVTVGSTGPLDLGAADKTRNEFQVIRSALYEGLKTASTMGLTSIALPLMGTGVLGTLRTNSNSMQALFEAIQMFNTDFPKAKRMKVTVAAFSGAQDFLALQNLAERTETRGIKISPQLNARTRLPIAAKSAAVRCEQMFASAP